MTDTALDARLTRSAWWLIGAVFITDIGNGLYTLSVAKLLFDSSGSVAPFGTVIILEYLITALLQLVAGSWVDRSDLSRTAVTVDLLRGGFIVLAALAIPFGSPSWWIFASVLVINLGKPFHRAATFAMGPVVAPGEALTRYTALWSMSSQAGQLLGIALAGVLLTYFAPAVVFALNGLSYLLAAGLTILARVPSIERNLAHATESWLTKFRADWQEMLALLRNHRSLGFHLMLCAGDFLAISFLNLAIVPLVAARFAGIPLYLSVLDGSYAVGSMLTTSLIAARGLRYPPSRVAQVSFAGQAVAFLMLAASPSIFLAATSVVLMAIFNTVSLTNLMTRLALRSKGPIKGRVSALRQLVLSAMAGALIPLVSQPMNLSVTWGLIAVAGLLFLFAAAALLLTRRFAFGEQLFGVAEPL